ncbi:MAG: hypothetical protein HYU86_11820 [Chloroflexi bacterium]|nr:hypothetical protein [Chloroflexota bacterium]
MPITPLCYGNFHPFWLGSVAEHAPPWIGQVAQGWLVLALTNSFVNLDWVEFVGNILPSPFLGGSPAHRTG